MFLDLFSACACHTTQLAAMHENDTFLTYVMPNNPINPSRSTDNATFREFIGFKVDRFNVLIGYML